MKTDKEMILEMFAKDVDILISRSSGYIITTTHKRYELEFESIKDAYKFHCPEIKASKYFSIDGYWKDDNYEFRGYIVKEFSDIDEAEDNIIFYYGLAENEIREIIEKGSELDFAITSVSEIEKFW